MIKKILYILLFVFVFNINALDILSVNTNNGTLNRTDFSNSTIAVKGIIIDNIDIKPLIYPVFNLQMGGYWTDFEIKASTNNFVTLVYYYISSNNSVTNWDDSDTRTYYTDDYSDDVRRWIRATNHMLIASQLISTNTVINNIIFSPSRNMIGVDDWMTSTNTKLVWSWVRFDGLDFEKNKDGTKQRWNPIKPISWEINRINP